MSVESKSEGLWLKGSVGGRSPSAARKLDYLPSYASRRQFGPLVNGTLSGLTGFVPGTPFLRALIRLSAPSLLARKEPTRLSNQPIEEVQWKALRASRAAAARAQSCSHPAHRSRQTDRGIHPFVLRQSLLLLGLIGRPKH